jgi:N-acetyl-anhydromuramyl-L-alanine amidase AmpD
MNITYKPSPNKSPRVQGDPIELVIVHSRVAPFESSLSWLRNPASKVSSHYLISQDGDIVCLVDETECAHHAGVSFWRGRTNLNRYSIGIELADRAGAKDFKGQDPYPESQSAALAWLVKNICSRRNIPMDRQHIITHQEIAPRRTVDPIGYDMANLMRRIGGHHEVRENDAGFVVPSRINIRQGPGTNFPIAGQAFRGQKLYIDTIVHGERLMGSDLWAHMARRPPEHFDMGFIKLELLRRATDIATNDDNSPGDTPGLFRVQIGTAVSRLQAR